ncbi:MAG: DMT family transporter [Alphaproteobacteria bacterium]|nr:DMT family transporter [Alphaproteobacteria bacterium]
MPVLATPVEATRSDPLGGALWMLGSTVFFTAMTAMIRYVSGSIDPLEIVFFRNLFGLVVLLPWLLRHGGVSLRTRRLPLYSLRALVGLIAMTCWFTAISQMNLGDAVALSFTAPLFATVGAVLLLSEIVRVRRWVAVLMGFAGAMVILRPGFAEIPPAAFVVLLSSMMMGLSVCLVKLLARTEQVMAIVFTMVLMLTPVSLIPALFVWQTPDLMQFAWLLAIGACGTLGHICITRAFSISEATAVLPYDFMRLPLMAVLAWLVFDQVLDIWTGVGAIIIIGSSLYIAHREAYHHRRLARPEAP